MFLNNAHVGQCKCQWCRKDLANRAGEPDVQNFNFNFTLNNSYTDFTYDTSGVSGNTHTSNTIFSSLTQDLYEEDSTVESSRQSGVDISTSFLTNSTHSQASKWDSTIQDSTHSDVHLFSGSLQNSPYKGSFGNYSLKTIEGATCNNSTLDQVDRREGKHDIISGLHVQWGLLFKAPLPALANTSGSSIEHSSMEEWVQLAYKETKAHNCPNYAGARVRVISQLNTRQWRMLLKDYKYNRVADYIEFGFPLSLDYDMFQYNNQIENHASALKFPTHVSEYLQTEKQFKAIAGPFDEPPFDKLHTSLMITRAKPDGSRRLIVGLSWPQGASVNSSIPDDELQIEIPHTGHYSGGHLQDW